MTTAVLLATILTAVTGAATIWITEGLFDGADVEWPVLVVIGLTVLFPFLFGASLASFFWTLTLPH